MELNTHLCGCACESRGENSKWYFFSLSFFFKHLFSPRCRNPALLHAAALKHSGCLSAHRKNYSSSDTWDNIQIFIPPLSPCARSRAHCSADCSLSGGGSLLRPLIPPRHRCHVDPAAWLLSSFLKPILQWECVRMIDTDHMETLDRCIKSSQRQVLQVVIIMIIIIRFRYFRFKFRY